MNVSVQHTDLFPTRLWIFDLMELAPHFPAWRTALARLREQSPSPAGRSNRGGWNSDKKIFDDPLFAALRATCQRAFSHAFLQTDPKANFSFRLEAWANIHDSGGYNLYHLHQNVLLSGCFYLSTPEGSGDLVFRDPRPGVQLSPFSGKGANANQLGRVTPRAGMLVVFPNWLEHAVDPNNAPSARVSIAMNALTAPATAALAPQ
jgi:uncharacterized protein (TIGR02466 family)